MPGPPLDAPQERPRVLADRYEVGELLGSGGMADVRAGWDRSLQRRVAVKLLRSPGGDGWDGADGRNGPDQLRREARAVASLNHPNVVAVHDTGTYTDAWGTAIFVVMELVDGRSLDAVLADQGPLPVEAVERVVAQTASALGAAHRAGLVHLDVKPSNIMLGPDGTVKLMDFGIATIASGVRRTTGVVVGTPAYMSPEQVRGEAVDARSDVYSLGCCAYEMLTGRPPFTGDGAVETAWAHMHRPPPVPTSLRPGIPPAVEAVVLRALAKAPDERQQSVTELAGDLAAAAQEGRGGGEGVPAPGSTLRLPFGPVPAVPAHAAPGTDGLAALEDAPDEDAGRWSRRVGLLLVVAGSTALLVVVVLLALGRLAGGAP